MALITELSQAQFEPSFLLFSLLHCYLKLMLSVIGLRTLQRPKTLTNNQALVYGPN